MKYRNVFVVDYHEYFQFRINKYESGTLSVSVHQIESIFKYRFRPEREVVGVVLNMKSGVTHELEITHKEYNDLLEAFTNLNYK